MKLSLYFAVSILMTTLLFKDAQASCNLRVAIPSIMSKKDPIKAMSWWEKRQTTLQFDTLIRFGTNGDIEPWLAKKWIISPDSKSLYLEIRQGVKFSDGTALTSTSVVESLNRYFGPESVDRDRLKDVESITSKSPLEIEIKLKRPFSPFLYYLATPRSSITKWVDAENIIGTGPWIPKRSQVEQEKQSANWERNPNYFQGPPICDSLSLIQIDTISMARAMKSDQVDLIEYYSTDNLGTEDVHEKFGPNSLKMDFPTYDVTALFFSLEKEKSVKLEDRKLVANLINTEMKRAKLGYLGRTCSILPFGLSKSPSKCSSLHFSRKEKIAREIEIFIQSDEIAVLIKNLAKSAGKKGANLKLNLVTLKKMYEEHAKGNISAHVETLTMQIPDPFGVLSLFVSGAAENFSKFSDKQFDSIIATAVKEPDLKKRSALYSRAEKILLQHAIVIPIVNQSRMAIVAKSISGYNSTSVGPFYASYNKVNKIK